MKRILSPSIATFLLSVVLSIPSMGQMGDSLQYFRPPGAEGVHVYEAPKDTNQPSFDGLTVRLGGNMAFQFQALSHQTGSGDTLVNLGQNFNLPTADLNLDVQLAPGARMHLKTYLSSRHHPDSWVKGGYLQLDRLDLIAEDLLENLMKHVTLKVGMDEINYGDAHFRRSDNARTLYNPFVGNYIMDAFTTEPFGEVYGRYNGFILMAGISSGSLNPSVVKGDQDPLPSPYGKIGYDGQLNEDLRVRLTGSFYNSPSYDNGQYLYNGDRTGSRYYNVMQPKGGSDDFRSGRFDPGFRKYTAVQVNPFIKWKGLELFGVYEQTTGDISEEITDGRYTQMGTELLYRFGKEEQFYFGGRYNTVTGEDRDGAPGRTIDRINAGGGCFLTDNILVKAEYVAQEYTGDAWEGSKFEEGSFSGGVVEAVIGF